MPVKGASVAQGDLIDGRYLVEALLGPGGMAVVHRARHTGTGATYALKLVHPHLVPRRELIDLFLREARVGGRIGKSPNVVEVIDAGFDDARGVPYLVMELLEGETLEDYAAREGALPLPLLCVVLEQVADALEQAHRAGVVHRDLKPGNLFLTAGRRGAPCVKVMDFGIAKVLEAGAQHTATQIGTPAYAAPEQMGAALRAAAARQGITVASTVSPATDVWALGLLAYELCTGLPAVQFWAAETTAEIPVKAVLFPHDAPSFRAGDRAALLPPGFDAWFGRATDVDAARRWPTAGEAIGELLRLLVPAEIPSEAPPPPSSLPRAPSLIQVGPVPRKYGPGSTEIGTPPPSAVPPAASRSRRRLGRTILATGSTLVVLGAAGAGAAVVLAPRLRPSAPETCRASGERCEEACEAGDAWSCGRLGARYEHGLGGPRDEARAAALYKRACGAADPFSCTSLGRMARLGKGGLPRDLGEAGRLFQKACDAVDRDGPSGGSDASAGCTQLGELYREGTGLPHDEPRALSLFTRACKRGDPTGCKDQGGMREAGKGGLPRDEAEAAALYQKACDGGEVLGCNDLGVIVGAGRGGLPRDEHLAAELYERACNGGEMLGCDNLAWMIERGKGGLPPDPQRAVVLYRHACDRGDARGCGNLAVMYEQGKGLPPDLPRAAALYRQACTAGDAHACDNLGAMTERGLGGLPRDDTQAATLYQSACEAADMDGCNDLGRLIEAGRGGLTRDDARALALYDRACDGGALRACVNQGVLLSAGRGGPRDDRRAVSLWQRACDGGIAGGCADLGWAYFLGHGVLRDRAQGLALLRKGCDGGSTWGCDRLDEAHEPRKP